jgi:hypothetical protein
LKRERKKLSPSLNGGRFAKGNPGGPGNPLARQVNVIRSALLNALTPADVEAIIKAMIAKAKKGQLGYIKELFDRSIGKSSEADVLLRIEALEEKLNEQSKFPT